MLLLVWARTHMGSRISELIRKGRRREAMARANLAHTFWKTLLVGIDQALIGAIMVKSFSQLKSYSWLEKLPGKSH